MEMPGIHAGHRERIRRRFEEQGLSGFAEHEVLELLLTFAIARKDVNPLAHELLTQFGSLSAVLEADKAELMRVNGVGENTAALITLMPELFRHYQRNALGAKPVVSTPQESRAYCRSLFFGAHEEMVYVLCLDRSSRVLHPALLRRGTLDAVTIYPREVVELAIRHHAHAVILTHNHPSGHVQPSQADIDITARIAHALASIDVKVLDHLILSGGEVYSMKRGVQPNAAAPQANRAGLHEETPQTQELTLSDLLEALYKGE